MEILTIPCTCMNYGSDGVSGKFVVTSDTIAFYPSKLMKTLFFWSNWPDFVEDIHNVHSIQKAALGFLDISTKNYSIRLNTFHKDKIINAIKQANPKVSIQ